MAIQSTDIEKIYIGSTEADAMYKGSVKVWEKNTEKSIRIADGLTSSDVGNYGENAYIYIDKADESYSVYFEWDIEMLDNYLDVLNLNTLGSQYGGGSGTVSNYCITAGGNLATGDNYQGAIYNFSMKKIDDVWIPIFGISNASGYRVTLNTASYENVVAGRHSYFLGDSYYNSNKRKFDLFSLCNFSTGAPVASRWGDWFMLAPAHFTPFYKIYSLKIWDDSNKTNLLHEFLPDEQNGHKGVFDTVTETFYPVVNDNFFVVE